MRSRFGSDLSSDCWSSGSVLSRLSSSQGFRPVPGPEETAFAIAMAADMPSRPGAGVGVSDGGADLTFWMAVLSASLIASASGRALAPAVNEKTYCSAALALGGWTNIFSITLGLLAGVCCRSSKPSQFSSNEPFEPFTTTQPK